MNGAERMNNGKNENEISRFKKIINFLTMFYCEFIFFFFILSDIILLTPYSSQSLCWFNFLVFAATNTINDKTHFLCTLVVIWKGVF